MTDRFLFVAHVSLCRNFIHESWTQSVDISFLRKGNYSNAKNKLTKSLLPDPTALPAKMLRGHRPEFIEFYPMGEDGKPDISRKTMSRLQKLSPNTVLGLLWVDLEHTIDFRDDAVQDLRERDLEEPTSVQEFLALGYEVEQIEAIQLTGFSTRIEKVKLRDYEASLRRQRPDLCAEDGPWLINVIDMSHGNIFTRHEIQELTTYMEDAFRKLPFHIARQQLSMIMNYFPKEYTKIASLPIYQQSTDAVSRVRILCKKNEQIALAVPKFGLPAKEHFVYLDLHNDVIGGHLWISC